MLQFGHNVRKKSYLGIMNINSRRKSLTIDEILGGKEKAIMKRRQKHGNIYLLLIFFNNRNNIYFK